MVESHLLTLLGSAVLSVAFAFLTMRWVIKDLRQENATLRTQVVAAQASATASGAAAAANMAKLLVLEAKVEKCETERKDANDRLRAMSDMCPKTGMHCPLRQYFGKGKS